jgi:N-acetylglucosaminyldiphosphoundecaprenol N-acetyl-beta-D-mannosaminyltransferase
MSAEYRSTAKPRRSVLGVAVSPATYDTAVAAIMEAAEAREPFGASALAVHGVMTGALDRTHRLRLNSLDLLVPDGQPVRWALKWLHGIALPDRVYGPELMRRLCREAEARRVPVFFYGSTRDTLDRLIASLRRELPQIIIAGAEPSKFRTLEHGEREEMLERIRSSGASLLFVGLGCPRQEVWAYENTLRLGIPVVAVGAAFPFQAGLLPQAPAALQRAGLEWLFRLACEPRRLWRRYVLLNPLYLLMVAAQRAGMWCDAGHPPPDTAIPELRYG